MAVHFGGRGPGHLARTRSSPSVGDAPVLLSENRPTSLALAQDVTTAGDSTVVGVGTSTSPTDYGWPGQLALLLTSGSILREEVSGMAYRTPAGLANTSPIPDQIAGQGATPLANNSQVHGTGINDINSSVVPEADTRVWASTVLAALGDIETTIRTGGDAQWSTYYHLKRSGQGPGMVLHADWRWLHRAAQALFGARVFDMHRYLRSRGPTDPTDLDYINCDLWADYPLTFHGSSTDPFAANPQTTWQTVSTATNTRAGIDAAASTLPGYPFPENTFLQNISTTLPLGGNVWRMTANGWTKVDDTHPSRWGYAVMAQAVFDILAAVQGDGPPMACPAELFCAQDAAAGTDCGTIYYAGGVPATMALFDANGDPVTTLTLTDDGSTNNSGSISVTRSATGTLSEGEQILTLQLTDGDGHVLHSVCDFRIGQPATQTVPRLQIIPGSASSPASDFSMVGRSEHGLLDAAQFFVVGWVKPSALGDVQYLVNLNKAYGGSADLFVRISATGQLTVISHDAANTLVFNTSTAGVFGAGVATWFAIDLDTGPAAATIKGYYQRDANAPVAINTTGPSGSTTLALDQTVARFFSLRDAGPQNEHWTAPDSARGQFRGAFGNLIVGNGSIGIAGNATLRDTLWDASGQPVSRAPFASIGSQNPIFDIQGGIGDLLRGGFDPNKAVYGTYRGIKGLIAA